MEVIIQIIVSLAVVIFLYYLLSGAKGQFSILLVILYSLTASYLVRIYFFNDTIYNVYNGFLLGLCYFKIKEVFGFNSMNSDFDEGESESQAGKASIKRNYLLLAGLIIFVAMFYMKAVHWTKEGFTAEEWFYKGRIYIERGDFKSAVFAYDNASSLNPMSIEPYYNKGLLYAAMGEYEKAIYSFDRSIQLFGKSADVYNYKGVCYMELGKYDEAVKNFNKALDLEPKNEQAIINLDYIAQLKKEKVRSRMGNN